MEDKINLKMQKRQTLFRILFITVLVLDSVLILLIILSASGLHAKFYMPMIPVLVIFLVITAIFARLLFLRKRDEKRARQPADYDKPKKETRYKLYIIISSFVTVVSIIILSLAGTQIICDSMNCIVYALFGGLLLIASMISNITLGRRLYQKRRTSLDNQKI